MEHHILFQSELNGTRYRICKNVYTGKVFKQILLKGMGKHGGIWITAMAKVYINDDPIMPWLIDAIQKPTLS
jgi:hypothetical protein